MSARSAPQPDPAEEAAPDGLEMLGRRAADLAAAAGHHAGLLLDEARYRVTQTIREAILSLALSATAIVAAAVGYGMLIRELADWLAGLWAGRHPEPVRILVYAVMAVLPLALLKARTWWHDEKDLKGMERRHARPRP